MSCKSVVEVHMHTIRETGDGRHVAQCLRTSEAHVCACGFTGGCWFVLYAVAGLAADDLGVFVVEVRVGDVTDSLRSRPILCSMSPLGNSV